MPWTPAVKPTTVLIRQIEKSTCILNVFLWFPDFCDSWDLWPAAKHSDPSQYWEAMVLNDIALSSATLIDFFFFFFDKRAQSQQNARVSHTVYV